jgi:hypothetical protein
MNSLTKRLVSYIYIYIDEGASTVIEKRSRGKKKDEIKRVFKNPTLPN